MNLKLLIPSFIIIITTHYILFTYEFQKETISSQSTTYQKVNINIAKLEKQKEIKKVVKEVKKQEKIKPKKAVIKKEKYVKPIRKKASKPIVKEKILKKTIEKKTKEIKAIKKQTVTKEIKEPTDKTTEKPIKKADVQIKKQINDYLSKLKSLINKNKRYPKISRRLNEQGKVIISFKLLKNGLIKDIKVISSSGKKRLDKAALYTVKDIKQFLPIPDKFNKEFFDLTIPMNFELK